GAEPPPAPPPLPPPDTGGGGSGLRTAGIVSLALAGVAAGVSVGLGVAALSAKDTFLASRTQKDFDAANHLETATNVGWAATAVLGAAGATLVVVSLVATPKSPSAWLTVRPGGASLVGRF
ncbi:MAG TPA: hypothetical protein VHB21_18940, partial [Minicystis sp.]|nr:hypothetical protein [Minicystis sp.]